MIFIFFKTFLCSGLPGSYLIRYWPFALISVIFHILFGISGFIVIKCFDYFLFILSKKNFSFEIKRDKVVNILRNCYSKTRWICWPDSSSFQRIRYRSRAVFKKIKDLKLSENSSLLVLERFVTVIKENLSLSWGGKDNSAD